jgi:hypothetical protein
MPSPRSAKLALACHERTLVRFYRPYEEGAVDGYVLSVGPQFFLVAVVGDEIRFNGYQCFRVGDVRRMQAPSPRSDFYENALKLRRERIPKMPRVSLASLPDLLQSASRKFPLVTIYREKVDPNVCQIGRVTKVAAGNLQMLGIDPDAKWYSSSDDYRLTEITRVDFGGGYEEALSLVGGPPAV